MGKDDLVTRAGPAFPIIHTADMAAALACWADGLGFAETFRFPPGGDATFVTVERAGSTIGLALVVPGAADGRLGVPMLPATGIPCPDVRVRRRRGRDDGRVGGRRRSPRPAPAGR